MAGVNVGLLTMQTREVQGAAAGTNFSVARVRKGPCKSLCGRFHGNQHAYIWMQRDASPVEEDNQALAVDGRWGIGEIRNYLRLCCPNIFAALRRSRTCL